MPKIQTVCIVDDAKGMRALGKKVLADTQIEVFTAVDGFDAMLVIREKKPDAVFIDRDMPVLDGLKLISLLRGWNEWGNKPIAMLTSAGSVFDKQVGLLMGANLYLTKPFTKDTLQKAITAMGELSE